MRLQAHQRPAAYADGMAGVLSQLTRIHDAEGSLTTANLPAGGAAASANTDIFLQGAQSLGRRQTNTTDTGGFLLIDAADNNCSAADVHVGVWFWVTHYGILDDLRIILATGTGSPTNYDSHAFPLTEYPKLGGWVRGWVDVSRTPEVVGGTGLDEAALRSYGVQLSFTAGPGGNAQNLIVDAADFTNGSSALVLTGSSGLWSDFTTTDENSSNQYGVFRSVGGVYNCFARVQLGASGSSLVFDDTSFTIVFPQQNLVSDTFMGVSSDLRHVSSSITMTNGVISSAGAKQGDFVVTGTSGTLAIAGMTFSKLRAAQYTSRCFVSSSNFLQCGRIVQSTATFDDCAFVEPTGTVCMLSDRPDLVADCSFTSAGTGHAMELSVSGTYTFVGNTFVGYGAGGTTDAAVYNNSSGSITLNVTGGGSTPTVRNGTSASTVVNSNVSITLTGLKNPTEVRVFSAGTTTAVAGQEDVTSGQFAFSVGAGVSVDIAVLALGYQNLRILGYSSTVDASIPVSQQLDRQYNNP